MATQIELLLMKQMRISSTANDGVKGLSITLIENVC